MGSSDHRAPDRRRTLHLPAHGAQPHQADPRQARCTITARGRGDRPSARPDLDRGASRRMTKSGQAEMLELVIGAPGTTSHTHSPSWSSTRRHPSRTSSVACVCPLLSGRTWSTPRDERSLTVAIIGLGSMETIVTTIGIAEGIELFEFVTTGGRRLRVDDLGAPSRPRTAPADHADSRRNPRSRQDRTTSDVARSEPGVGTSSPSISASAMPRWPPLRPSPKRYVALPSPVSVRRRRGSVRIGFRAGMDVTSPHVVMLEAELSSPEAAHELSVGRGPIGRICTAAGRVGESHWSGTTRSWAY